MFQVGEAKHRLANECGVRPPPLKAAEQCAKLLNGVQQRPAAERDFLDSTARALVLLCRSQEYRWTHNTLVNSLMEIFKRKTEELALAKARRDEQAAKSLGRLILWIIEMLGKVCRLYPTEARDQCITPLHKSVESFLAGAENRAMEESCLRALLGLGHHMQVLWYFIWYTFLKSAFILKMPLLLHGKR